MVIMVIMVRMVRMVRMVAVRCVAVGSMGVGMVRMVAVTLSTCARHQETVQKRVAIVANRAVSFATRVVILVADDRARSLPVALLRTAARKAFW